jgi:hypothetical protein
MQDEATSLLGNFELSLIEKLKKLPGITKGMLGAMGFLGAAPTFLPYNVLEIVSFVNAVILGWNSIMSAIWGVIAGLLLLPDVPPEVISAAVLGFSLSSTWAYSILRSEWGQHQGFLQNAAYWTRIVMAFFDGPIILAIIFATYPSAMFWMALVAMFFILFTSLSRLPRFRAGFLTIFGFLGFLEGVYLLSTDAVRDTFVCDRQSVGLPQCEDGELSGGG